MRVRRLQRKDEDGVWYDDAYAFENGKQPVTFRYNLTLGRVGSNHNGQIKEQNILLDEIEKVIPEGEYVRWLNIEVIEEEQAETYLDMLDQICYIPKPRSIRNLLLNAA